MRFNLPSAKSAVAKNGYPVLSSIPTFMIGVMYPIATKCEWSRTIFSAGTIATRSRVVFGEIRMLPVWGSISTSTPAAYPASTTGVKVSTEVLKACDRLCPELNMPGRIKTEGALADLAKAPAAIRSVRFCGFDGPARLRSCRSSPKR